MLFLIVRHQSVQFTYGMMLSTPVFVREYLFCRHQQKMRVEVCLSLYL